LKRALLAALCVLTSLAGCSAILGIDKFEECPGSCLDASVPDVHEVPDVREANAPDTSDADAAVDADAAFETGADVEIIPLERLWARWPMPTAETIGDASPYDDGGSSALVDPVTHLTWQRATIAVDSYETARATCGNLLPGGSWKVPTRIELATLIDPTRDAGPAWSTSFAEAGASVRLWTASRVYGTSADHWVIDFASGAVLRGGGAGAVRCVRLP
jgi:hypothetical protein